MLANQPCIVVVGSANVDLTIFTDRFPEQGETMFGERFQLGFGGKGANQAVAVKHCGADVHMVACVGDDLFGTSTIANFESLKIGVEHVSTVAGASSGVAPIFVDKTGQNRIIVIKGANDHLTPAKVDLAESLLRQADVILLQFEIPLETVYHTLQLATRHKIRCILNPAPALPADLDQARLADYFIPNETEAARITGLPVRTLGEARACASHLLELGFPAVLLTLGSRGCFLAEPSGMERLVARNVEAVDTTGAGDAFIGSLAVFLAEGHSSREAALRANLYAAMSTTAVGTQASFASREAFEREWMRIR